MIEWTVASSSDFDISLAEHFAEFKARIATYNAKPSGKEAKDVEKRFRVFQQFLHKIYELEDTKILPKDCLAYVQDDATGIPIYSLIYKNWRCLYLVREKEKTCTAIKIQLMSDNLRYVEEDRHKSGKKLKSVH